jgi:hypothetical protein
LYPKDVIRATTYGARKVNAITMTNRIPQPTSVKNRAILHSSFPEENDSGVQDDQPDAERQSE